MELTTFLRGRTTASDPQYSSGDPVEVVKDDQTNDPPQELDDSEETMNADDRDAIDESNILSDKSEVGVRDKKTGSYKEPGDEEEFGERT